MTPYEKLATVLTDRQIDVFVGLVSGLSLTSVAENTGQTLTNAGKRREEMMQNLDCISTEDVKRYAARLGVAHVKTVRELMEIDK